MDKILQRNDRRFLIRKDAWSRAYNLKQTVFDHAHVAVIHIVNIHGRE